jgi:menaquinol-cytochrome c reductase iron-sulfur subunit
LAQHDEEREPTTSEEGRATSPARSVWPLGFALGVALLLIGVVLNWVVFGIGVGIAALTGMLWVWDSTRTLRRPTERVEEPVEVVEEREAPERYGRDVFLERTTLGLGALIGVGVTAPVVGFAVAPTFIGQADKDIDLGPLTNFPKDQYIIATFLSDKAAGQVSRRTAFIRNNGTTQNGLPSFTIISSRCVHLGCPTQPQGLSDENAKKSFETDTGPVTLTPTQPSGFSCPCHGGAYDTEGRRTAGPPVRDLDRYSYKIVKGNLVLGERFSVADVQGDGANAVLKTYKRFDPGQHVDGPDAWMYPASPRGI